MQIKWLKKALFNLEQELNFIARHNPKNAQLVAKRINDAINLLRDSPYIGRPGRVKGTRELPIPKTRLMIPYRVNQEKKQIEILRVFHASRKAPPSW